jgi:hypothetical protein
MKKNRNQLPFFQFEYQNIPVMKPNGGNRARGSWLLEPCAASKNEFRPTRRFAVQP